MIHPSALVDSSARLAPGVSVGPFAVIEADVVIGEGTTVGAHALVSSGTRLGKNNKIFPYAAVGGDPQDLKYKGEKTTLELGDENMVREYVTLHKGTAEGGGITRIGSHNLFMANSHIAHDCQVGSHIVLANSVAIAGHCVLEDHVIVGGLTGLHQFARIGTYAMAGAMSRLAKDVLPYSLTSGCDEIKCYGLNKIGLRRSGLSKEDYNALEEAFHLYLKPSFNVAEALKELEALPKKTAQVVHLIHFIKTSTRGLYR